MEFLSIEYLKNLAHTHAVPFAINLVIAIAIFFVGRAVAKLIVRLVDRMLAKTLDESLRKFLGSILHSLLLAVVIIAALERLGVKTTAAIAILGAAGLAVGLALQGSLGNFASGVMLVLFRPYRIGDLVTVAGQFGVVKEIDIFNTVLTTPDNKRIIVPNGKVTSDVIENVSVEGTLRVDLEVGIGYTDDIEKAKKALEDVLASHSKVLASPAPQVAVCALADSSVNFVVRPWCKVEDYWDVRFETLRNCKEQLDANGISIPFPQRDLHVYQQPVQARVA